MNCTTSRHLWSSLFKAGLLYLLVFTYGCSNPTSIEDNGITFKNSTTKPLVLSVYDQELLNTILLLHKDSSAIDVDSLNILEPDQDTTVFQRDIYLPSNNGPVKDVGVFISEVKNDSLFYKGRYTFTENQLEKYKHHLTIEEGAEGLLVIGE